MTTYYVDANGTYLGGFDGAQPPAGSIPVPTPPNHGLDKWDGVKWVSPVDYKGKELAAKRIAEIRLELADHLATVTVGTPAEQAVARAAIGSLRAELALNKAKL